jgi:hypothetical protein
MALQTVDTVVIADLSNPVELQSWFTAHPLAVITAVTMESNVFYIIHT